ncbi:MAG: LLM class flavin-dependent oxidoreductase [Ferrimicrobium sp.]
MSAIDSNVRVSLFLTNQQVCGKDQVTAFQGQLELCKQVRDAGWDGVFVGQHHLSEGLSHLQSAPVLGRLAVEAGGMRLGIGISLLALHNPVDLAETYATIDVLCGGRLIFGVGLGYRDVEYQAFGIQNGERVRRFEANLEVILALWSGEAVTADLPWCRLESQRLSLVPVQRPRPQVWMAANSDAAVRRAARLADAWMINPHATRATIERQLRLYRDSRLEAGRPEIPSELPAMREVFCASSRERAKELAGPYLGAKYEAYSRWGQDKVLPGDESFSVPIDRLAEDRFIVGTPDDCLSTLVKWRDELGVNHFVIRTDWAGMPTEATAGSIRLLTDEVIPELRCS